MDQRGTPRWIGGAILAIAALTGCDARGDEGATVGPRGAVLVAADGNFSVAIPAGALTDAVAITIEETDCDSADAVDTCYEVGPVGLPLLRPARVTYTVDAEMLESFDAEQLAVYVERDEAWSELADRRVHPGVGFVSASAVYLSSYALVATTEADPTRAPTRQRP